MAWSETSRGFGNDSGSSTTTVSTGAGLGTPQNVAAVTGQPIIGGYACANGGTVTGIADTVGNTYTILTPETTFGPTSVIFYCASSIGTNAANVVTATVSAATTFKSIAVVTGTGLDTGAGFFITQQPGFAAAASVSPTNPLACGSSDALLVFALTASNDRGFDVVSGGTEIHDAFDDFASRCGSVQYKPTTGGGSQSVTASVTGGVASNLGIAAAAFKIAILTPIISVQPVQQTVASGASATFSVTASSVTSYQWQINTVGTWTNVSTGTGGTTSSYTTAALGTSDIGNLYRCILTNAFGSTNTAEVFVFLTNQPSAGKGERGYHSAEDQRTTRRTGNIKANAVQFLRPNASRGPNKNNSNLTTTWFNWFFPAATNTTPTGTLVSTNANDTSSATALAIPNGTLSRTNANDTSSAAATTTILSTLARTNASDTSAATATPVSPGSLARSNANDTLAASGNTWPSSTLARTNANDTLAASGSVGSAADGSLARTNANDTSSAAGNTGILSTLARTNANDTLAASGSPVGGGTLARTNNNDTSASTAISTIVGTSSTTNANDTLSASGSAGSVPVGNLTYTNNNDTVSSSGSTTILSSIARTNNNDTLAASGSAGSGGAGVTTRLPLTGVGS